MNTSITPQTSCADPFDPESISLIEALQRIQNQVIVISDCETLPIRSCLNRVSHVEVKSPLDIPPYANSAMDGIAVAIESLQIDQITDLEIVGAAFAGEPYTGTINKGQCIRIMTGALIPENTDTVIMQEQIEYISAASVRVDANHRKHENIRMAGEDLKTGQSILLAGEQINPANLGVLASLGIAQLDVRRKPRVAFFSTGNELVSIDTKLTAGKIYDSNRYTLYGLLNRLPVDIIDLGVIPDQPDQIKATLADAAQQSDLILSTGGVSVGDADYIKPALEELGDTEFWKIAIKPGRPLTFGRIGNSSFMGLPGNPVAVMVTFSQFVIPALQKISGAGFNPPVLFKARSIEAMRKRPGRYEFQRGIASPTEDGNWCVEKTGKQGSGILSSMSRANCFIVLSDQNDGVQPGDLVDIQFFDWSVNQL